MTSQNVRVMQPYTQPEGYGLRSSDDIPFSLHPIFLWVLSGFLVIVCNFCMVPQAGAVEISKTREYVKNCRERGKFKGITDRAELREFIRECVEDVRETDVGTTKSLPKKEAKAKDAVIDIVVLDSESDLFDGKIIQKND